MPPPLISFTAWPEMLAWPYLMLNGWLPYRDIAIAHTPLLLIIASAWYKVFGLGLLQLQLLTWVIFSLSALLLYLTSRSGKALLVYAALWAAFGGNALWFDLALAPLAIMLHRAIHGQRPVLAGGWAGLMLLTKQTALWFILPALWAVRLRGRFLAALACVLAVFLGLLAAAGLLADFYVWAVRFGIFILPRSPGQIQLPTLKQLLLAVFPVVIFLFNKSNWRLLPWVVAGSLGVYPRWELFHLQPALPFLALGLGRSRLGTALVVGYCLALLARVPAPAVPRFFEPEFIQLVKTVKSRTSPGDRVFILNTWDHFYALTDTLPAVRPLIPYLPWYLDQPGIQEKVIRDLALSPPSLIVVRDHDSSGLGAYRPTLISSFLSADFYPVLRVGPYRLFGVK